MPRKFISQKLILQLHITSQFCPIALLNVEGKLFLSVQKCCMEKVPGCWEHISMVWAALKEAKSKNLSLATIWLDIANAYGSIPHKLIIFALFRYGVSPKWIHLIETYYSRIFSKSFCRLHSVYNTFFGWYEHNSRILFGSHHTTIPSK